MVIHVLSLVRVMKLLLCTHTHTHYLGISAVDQRKLWKFIGSNVSDSTSRNLTVHDRDEHTSQCVSSVHYIVCGKDLFSHDIVENVIDDLDPEKTTLSDVTAQIANEMGLNDDKAIELYSHEGYPLHHNDITSARKCYLR